MKKGKVYLVGAGPGHAGLITVRGIECLRRADVVIYDYLSNPAFLQSAKPSAKILYAGKKAGNHTLSQRTIESVMIRHAKAGRHVVRLKGGDPFLFGRGGEEAAALKKRGIPFEIVPGVTAGTAAPAFAGIPVTHRAHASAVAMITGHEQGISGKGKGVSVDFENLAHFKGTLVFFMGVERLGHIASELIRHGKKAGTPVALVRWGTTGRQQTLAGKLGDIAAKARKSRFQPPALIVVGDVVKLRQSLGWFERLPLFGKRVVVTRTRQQAGELRKQLEELGADVLELPTIEIRPPANPAPLRKAIAGIGRYRWLIFTSPNGIDAFFEEFLKRHGDVRKLGPVRIAAIGPATAAKLAGRGLKADLMPREYVAEKIVDEMKKQNGRGRVLLARADIARDALPRGLRKLGYAVDETVAYRTVAPARSIETDRLMREGADFITFTSSSTAENFAKLLGKTRLRRIPGRPKLISIGPVTSGSMRKLGMKPAAEAKVFTIPGLVDCLLKLGAKR
jgi:uroporphyrinogen III methyltransferase/synthase